VKAPILMGVGEIAPIRAQLSDRIGGQLGGIFARSRATSGGHAISANRQQHSQ
jgi:hypothetical protein